MLTGKSKVLAPSYKLVTAPAAEPVTVEDFHLHAQTTGLGQDLKIEDFLISARIEAENWTGRAFITQTWQAMFDVMDASSCGPFDDFWYTDSPSRSGSMVLPRLIELARPPLAAVSHIKYWLDDGVETEQTFSSTKYSVSTAATKGRILLKTGQVWPAGLRPMDSLKVTYTCGYGADGSYVPQDIKEAIIEWAAHMYENREGQPAANAGGAVVLNRGGFIPGNVQTKLAAYKIGKL
jgi:uncharacterized phiE125 gp8 family phage protein